jgi:hypothetical protein
MHGDRKIVMLRNTTGGRVIAKSPWILNNLVQMRQTARVKKLL